MNNLTVFNKEVIPVYRSDTGERVVIGRELYKKLSITTKYADWFKRMCEYGFIENRDFSSFLKNEKRETGATQRKEHIISLDMAKHIAMIQRTPQGKEIRQKLIDLEKLVSFRALPNNFQESLIQLTALTDMNNQLALENSQKDQIIGELKPKANYVDVILQSKGLVTVTQIAKDYGMSGLAMNKLLHDLGVQYKQSNQWLLYSKYQKEGYTQSVTTKLENGFLPTVVLTTKWTQKGRFFIYELLKKHDILPMIESDSN